jgi:hypothetical protein
LERLAIFPLWLSGFFFFFFFFVLKKNFGLACIRVCSFS